MPSLPARHSMAGRCAQKRIQKKKSFIHFEIEKQGEDSTLALRGKKRVREEGLEEEQTAGSRSPISIGQVTHDA